MIKPVLINAFSFIKPMQLSPNESLVICWEVSSKGFVNVNNIRRTNNEKDLQQAASVFDIIG